MLQTDASAGGIAGVLSVIRKEEELPICFFSRQLRLTETRYSATEREGLAPVKAIQHFGIYLLGQELSVKTDRLLPIYIHPNNSMDERCGGHFYYSHISSPRDTDLEPGTVMQMAYLGKRGQNKNKNDRLLWKGVMSGLNLTGCAGTALQRTSRNRMTLN